MIIYLRMFAIYYRNNFDYYNLDYDEIKEARDGEEELKCINTQIKILLNIETVDFDTESHQAHNEEYEALSQRKTELESMLFRSIIERGMLFDKDPLEAFTNVSGLMIQVAKLIDY